MKFRRLVGIVCTCALMVWSTALSAYAATDFVAAIPPGSEALISYFHVGWALEDVYVEAWNSNGNSTVRVAFRSALPNLVRFEDVTGPGLLTVAADRSTAVIDAELPTLGHLSVNFRWYGGGLVFERSGAGGPFDYYLVSPSGQLTTDFYAWSGTLGDRIFVSAIAPVFGRDLSGVSHRTPI